jgi:transposase
MQDKDLYAQILGLSRPWAVRNVELDNAAEEIVVKVEHDRTEPLRCPECGKECAGYDSRLRRWRHLDTCQFKTILEAEVPRIECPEHGVRQFPVPWSEPNSGFTALFECLVINWLKHASRSAVSQQLRLTWAEVDGIMQRAVKRGLSRRKNEAPARLGVDETSFAKRHEYVTVVTDLDTSEVLYVGDDRSTGALSEYYRNLSAEELSKIEVVSMDMWKPYMKATQQHVPEADRKIAFDKFHVARHLGEAVDQVRRREHRELKAKGDDRLARTKHAWLINPAAMKPEIWRGWFRDLRQSTLRTARAWALKEAAMGLWEYVSRAWAEKAWRRWLGWAERSKLTPVLKSAAMIREHLGGIINAIVHRATNAGAESINSKIQRIKRMACGYRNRDRFRNAIYFHLGGLDLYPATHTSS